VYPATINLSIMRAQINQAHTFLSWTVVAGWLSSQGTSCVILLWPAWQSPPDTFTAWSSHGHNVAIINNQNLFTAMQTKG
jgi:hypothetical protein